MSKQETFREIADHKDPAAKEKSTFLTIGVVGYIYRIQYIINLFSDNGYNVIVCDMGAGNDTADHDKIYEKPAISKELMGCDVIITYISDDAGLRELVLGRRSILRHLPPEALHISMGVISPSLSRRLAVEHERLGQHYVAAQLLESPAAAPTVLVSGPAAGRGKARLPLRCVTKDLREISNEASAANLLKLAASTLLAMTIGNTSELLALTRKSGIDDVAAMDVMLETLKENLGNGRGGTTGGERFRNAIDSVRSYVNAIDILDGEAKTWRVPLPSIGASRDKLADMATRGQGDMELSVISLLSSMEACSAARIDKTYIF